MHSSRPSRQIPRDSFFARLRSLSRVGPVPHWDGEFGFVDEPDAFDKFENIKPDHLGPVARHLGHGQSHASVVRANVGGGAFTLTFGHYDYARLACVVKPSLANWHSVSKAFPVTLSFDGITEFIGLRRIEQGRYQRIRSTLSSSGGNFLDIGRLELVGESAGSHCFILRIHGSRPFQRKGKPHLAHCWNNTYYLCIACESVSVQDNSRHGWQRLLGPDQMTKYDAFDAVWPVPRWCMPDFEIWLEEFGKSSILVR